MWFLVWFPVWILVVPTTTKLNLLLQWWVRDEWMESDLLIDYSYDIDDVLCALAEADSGHSQRIWEVVEEEFSRCFLREISTEVL